MTPQLKLLAQLKADLDTLVEEPRGSNWGAAVKSCLNYVGIDFPAPWCAAWASQKLSDAGIPGPRTGWSPSFVAWFKSRGLLQYGGYPKSGWTFHIYYPSLMRVGHVGFVWDYNFELRRITTVEANTNKDGSREGYGVFMKQRFVKDIHSFGITT